ncbi:MAG TPA: hypothetical protein VMW08_04515 [Acidimicrobiales bacterium]|nr:hypothetical protein [Acidimicrobiales bacterium]
MDEATFDRRTLIAAALAILGFVALGVVIVLFGAPDDPESVLAGRASESTTTRETIDGPAVPATLTVAPIEIGFETERGLGFEERRTWVYDPTTRTLRNLVILEPDVDELLVGHTEVIPPSVLDLGDIVFDPETDDVTVADDGTETYRFAVLGRTDEPAELGWQVVTADELDEADLDALAADLVAAREAG